jgi:hypothetical protein
MANSIRQALIHGDHGAIPSGAAAGYGERQRGSFNKLAASPGASPDGPRVESDADVEAGPGRYCYACRTKSVLAMGEVKLI